MRLIIPFTYNFIFLFIFSYFFSKESIFKEVVSHKCIIFIFWLLVTISFISIFTRFDVGLLFYGKNKVVFPFGEPSHFSLFFAPFFFMAVVLSRNAIVKAAYILIVAIIALLFPSATLLIYVILASAISIRLSKSSFLIFILVFVFAIYTIFSSDYFISRIILSNDSDNLTALVYLQGLQDAFYSIKSTYGIGLGFQMLGTQPLSPAGEQISYLMGGVELNRQDGGFLAAKVVAELGLYGVMILIFYLFFFLKSFFGLSKVNNSLCYSDLNYIFSLSFIYASFVEFFVRGVGYFSPTIFFLIVSFFIYMRISKSRHFYVKK